MARATQAAYGYAPNHTVVPALVNAPIIFIAPSERTVSGGEIWIAVSNADSNYGGCYVWAANDNVHYRRLGKIDGNATQGILTAALASATGLDLTHTLSLNLSQSKEDIESTDQQSVDTYDSLCYVGGELLAYRDAALTGANSYNLTYLQRGLYNSTPGASLGASFALINNAIFKKRLPKNKVGKTLYFKFQGFNLVNKGLHNLADCVAYPFVVTSDGGVKALLSDLTNPYRGTFTTLTALQTALPTANAGDYAQVDAGAGSSVQNYFWDVTNAAWVLVAGGTSSANPVYSLNESVVGTTPTIIGSIRLPAGTYAAPSAEIGAGNPLYTATLELRKPDGMVLATIGGTAGGLAWRTALTGFVLTATTNIDLVLYGNTVNEPVFIKGLTF